MSEPLSGLSGGEPADETAPRDSEPALSDYEGDEDPEAEALLQQLAGGDQ